MGFFDSAQEVLDKGVSAAKGAVSGVATKYLSRPDSKKLAVIGCGAQGRSHLLWLLAEAGEAAQIIKKEGDRPILDCPETRAHFVEELCDVYMYLASTAMCYGITPQELAQTFVEKHRRNMQRW